MKTIPMMKKKITVKKNEWISTAFIRSVGEWVKMETKKWTKKNGQTASDFHHFFEGFGGGATDTSSQQGFPFSRPAGVFSFSQNRVEAPCTIDQT